MARLSGPVASTLAGRLRPLILAYRQGEQVRVWSRRGADFTDRFLVIADAARGLSADEALIVRDRPVRRVDGRGVVISNV